jgi:hypothetical protein
MTNEALAIKQAQPSSSDDLVVQRLAIPSKLAKRTQSEVVITTCAGSVIRIPLSLLKAETSEQFQFEARLPRDVAHAFQSVCGELFNLTRSVQAQATRAKATP